MEKSCWGITFWAVIGAVGLAVVGSFISRSNQTVMAESEVSAIVKSVAVSE